MLRKLSIALAALVASGAAPAHAFTFIDDFSASSIDTGWWTASATGGNTVTQAGGRLVMTQSEAAGRSDLAFKYPVTGDFVVTVDYALDQWPDANFERAGIVGPFGAMERSQHVNWFNDSYVSDFSGFGDGVYTTPTIDREGTLRVERAGDKLIGSFRKGDSWEVVREFSAPGVSADTTLGLGIWNGYASVPVQVAFDNFRLEAPQMQDPSLPIPEPSTHALLLTGLGLLGLAARRLRARASGVSAVSRQPRG